MARSAHLGFNRKFETVDGRTVRREKILPHDVRKVGSCWRCGEDITAGSGQMVRTTVHRRCEKAGIRPPLPKPSGIGKAVGGI